MSRGLRYASEADLPPGVRLAATGVSEICAHMAAASKPRGRRGAEQAVGRGVAKSARGMNKTEAAYAEHLAARQHAGEVAWFEFEAMKLRLADKTFYTPDFAVMLADGTIEQHEVKGFWEDDARVKIKVAAALFPFRFIGVKKSKGGWDFEAFTREAT